MSFRNHNLIDRWGRLDVYYSHNDHIDLFTAKQIGECIMPKVSVAHTKSHLSEIMAKCAYNHERFIITRRNKPVAALVSIEDLRIIEQHEERAGLAGIAGKWPEFDEVATSMGDIAELRRAGGGGRNVSL